jgi:hypothetical protein
MPTGKTKGFGKLVNLRKSKSANPVQKYINAGEDKGAFTWEAQHISQRKSPKEDSYRACLKYMAEMQNTMGDAISVRSVRISEERDLISLDPEESAIPATEEHPASPSTITTPTTEKNVYTASKNKEYGIPRKPLPQSASHGIDSMRNASTSSQPLPGAWPVEEPSRRDILIMPARPPPVATAEIQAPDTSETKDGDQTQILSVTLTQRSSSTDRSHGSQLHSMPSFFSLFKRNKKKKKASSKTVVQATRVQSPDVSPVLSPKRVVQVPTFDIVAKVNREELERITEQDALLAQAIQDEEEYQLKVDLQRQKELVEAVEKDRLFAEELIRKEEEDLARQIQEQEEAKAEAIREEIRRKEQLKQKELQRREKVVGAPIGVRRVLPAKKKGELAVVDFDLISPEVFTQLQNVKMTFSRGLPLFRVTKIEWIINDRLRVQFEKCREEFEKKGRDTSEILLFHGTGWQNIDPYGPDLTLT